LDQLQPLLMAACDGQEHQTRALVAEIVGTYQQS
jgi:hypothetical protein